MRTMGWMWFVVAAAMSMWLPDGAVAQDARATVVAAEHEAQQALPGRCSAQAAAVIELSRAFTRARNEDIRSALLRSVREARTGLRACASNGAEAPSAPSIPAPSSITVRLPQTAPAARGSGRFDARNLLRTMPTRRSAFERCYERALRVTPALEGRLTVEIVIDTTGASSGRVDEAASTASSVLLGACVVEVIEGLRFNPGPSEAPATYSTELVFERD